jgi:cytochrome c biogenesis protein CcmG, thiol:disulfide interchange protein DsbE
VNPVESPEPRGAPTRADGARPTADPQGGKADASTRARSNHPSMFQSNPGGKTGRRSRWVLVAAVLAAVALLASLLAFGLRRDPTVITSPLLGHRAPDFSLPTLDGPSFIRLSDLRGQVVVVNFWASWCAACREEHPNLLAAWERYRDKGVVLIGVDYQDSKTAALRFMREMGGDWPTVEDADGRTALSYGVYGVPETFFIGRDGVVRYKQIGASSYELLTDRIQGLLPRGG